MLLGTAATGGFPRWNCACALCAAARDGKLPARTPECAAVTGNSRDWWLLNTSPDLRAQLAGAGALWPGRGPGPLRGVLLTDGEPDHLAGLGVLRAAQGLTVYAAPPVLAGLAPARAALARYAPWNWRDGTHKEGFVLSGGLVVTAHPVPAAPPAYLPAPAGDGHWAMAYRIEDLATGGVLVYAPQLRSWTPLLDDLVADADGAVLDAAHCPTGPPDPAAWRGPRRILTRLEDPDPLLDPASTARARLAEAGIEILPDGTEFVL
ncbi:MBL fold metallo-hydrolase [Streptomyces sp. NPDC048290]|uniref:MBL fold metallo-hydrolase n=1 Tax=Streptomyces sp. NPDC048290 TaxID=3155811 RepID=UPI00342E9C5C